jgi:hypothetical protein
LLVSLKKDQKADGSLYALNIGLARGRYCWRVGTFVAEDTLGRVGARRDRSPILPGRMHRAKWYAFFSHISGPR